MELYGLSDEEVINYRNKYGSNQIVKANNNSFIKLFIESLGDPMIKILLIVLAIKLIFLFADFDWFETLGILIAIFVASLISTISEYGSDKAFQKLVSNNNKINVKVKRNGKIILINIDDIVVNDIVFLSSGDYVPADGLVVSGSVYVDESSINGESKEVLKSSFLKDEKNKLYKGTIISSNDCFMKVCSVGDKTLFGKITMEIQEKKGDSPLKTRLRDLARIISKIGYIGAFLVFFSYLFSVIFIQNKFQLDLILNSINNVPWLIDSVIYALTLSVTIIIVSVPEGLPMMVALVLSTNMKKMIKNNILVRKMVGIETSGSLNYLLTDKTGTLTNGSLSVYSFITPDGKIFNNDIELSKYSDLYNLLGKIIILNNECIFSEGNIINGNSTDKALLNFMSYNSSDDIISRENFSSSNKYSSVSTNDYTYYKGAPEVILNKCKYSYSKGNISEININYINGIVNKYMNKGYRVIALAYCKKDESDLIFVGIITLKDQIRSQAYEGISLIKKAGINIIMITGDSLSTAIYVSNELNLSEKNDIFLTSSDLDLMSDEEIKAKLSHIRIIARAKPTDKSRMVNIIKEMNLVVGMTGDGINDAAALKKSDVGFAMGSGTEVAKEASDIIILDNNIKSISMAILFGRSIFKNIRKFIIFQLTVNLCAMSLSIIGPFIGISTPVTVMQMLWINMIMDTLAGLAFAYETPEKEYMTEKPKTKKEPIINKYMYEEILLTGSYSAIVCILFLKIPYIYSLFRIDTNDKYFLTAFFCLFVFIGIFNAFNTRTNNINLLHKISNNKVFLIIFCLVSIIELYLIFYGGNIFRTYGLTLRELIIVLLIAGSVIPFDLLRKILLKNKEYV